MPSASDRIQAGFDILGTIVSKTTRKVLAQLGSVVGKTTDSDNAEWFQTIGLVSRPSRAEAGKQAAQAIVLRLGDRDVVIASQDLRGLELAGQLGDGETCIYAPGPDGKAQGRVIIKGDGSVNILTKKGNTDDGQGLGVFVRADGSIDVIGTSGAAVQLTSEGAIRMFNADGAIQITDAGGIKIASKAKIDISGPGVTIGGPSSLPLAVAPQVVAAINALQLQVAAQAAAWAALGALTGPLLGAMVQPVAAPVAGATAGGVAAVASAVALIPTKRVAAD